MGPHAMSGNPTGKVGLADAPAVELALSRSKVYLLLSWGFLFQQSHTMGDIAGYYKAFGLELAEVVHERLDHISVELEFLHFLAYKESYALCHDGEEKLQIVVDAEKKFVRDHIGRWAPLFADMASKKAQRGFFHLLCELCKAYLKFECAYLGVKPQPYKETDYKPATFI